MAQYWEDWAGQTIDSEPTGWTKRWVTTGVTFPVKADAQAPGGKCVRITRTTSGRSLLSMNAVDADANRATVNISALIRTPTDPGDSIGYTFVGPLGRGSGNAAAEQGYYVFFREETNNNKILWLNKYVVGTPTTLDPIDTAPYWAFGSLYWLHLSISGTTVRARLSTAAAPTTYIQDSGDFTDSSISAAGWVGIFSFANIRSYDVLAVGVGTGGDAAPLEPLATTHALTANNLVVSSPVLGAPSLNIVSTVDQLVASDLVVSSPVLGAPALSLPALEYVFVGDSFNIHPASSSITNPTTDTPTVIIAPRKQRIVDDSGDTTTWCNFYGKITNAAGKRPLFKLLVTDFAGTIYSTWKPWYSYDNVTWQRFPSQITNGSYKDFQLAAAFNGNDVWIGFMPGYPVSRTAALITELAASHADKLHQLPSANSSHIIEMLPSQTDELGATVPSQPFYGYGIWDASFSSDTPKRAVVLTCGIHPGEPTGDYVFEGFIRFLVSSDAKAVALRQNYQFLVYPNTNPMGRYGGHRRGSWDAASLYKNTNRDFGTDGNAFQLQNSQALRDALTLDLAGRELAGSLDFHGNLFDPSGMPASTWFTPETADTALSSAWEDRMQAYDSGYAAIASTAGPSATTQYIQREHGARHAYTPESYMMHAATTGVDAWLLAGEHFAKAIADSLEDMRADGAYPLYKTDELTAASLAVGAPALGTPALSENAPSVDALMATNLVVGSPVLGTPALGQIHELDALGLTVGVPVLGTPGLTSGAVAPITAAEVARIVRATSRMKIVTAASRVKQVRYEATRA